MICPFCEVEALVEPLQQVCKTCEPLQYEALAEIGRAHV